MKNTKTVILVGLLALVCVIMVVVTVTSKAKQNDNGDTSTTASTTTPTPTEATIAIDPNAMTSEMVAAKGQMTVTVNENPIDFNGKSATQVNGANTWKDITFYIFETVEDANDAFEYVKSDVLVDPTTTDNTVSGQKADAVGIPYFEFYYVTGNMLIMHTDFIGDPGSDKGPSEKMIADNDAIHERITTNW